jgi:hypothetical protein
MLNFTVFLGEVSMQKMIAVIFLFSFATSQAATVVMDGVNAIGINGLEIDGANYDLIFGPPYGPDAAEYSNWGAIFGLGILGPEGEEDSYLNSFDTHQEIATLLTGAGAHEIAAYGDSNITWTSFAIFHGSTNLGDICFEGGTSNATYGYGSGTGSWGGTSEYECVPYDTSLWALPVFKASVVPIPAAVWLFGSALAGLGWMRRKQTV